MRPPFRCPCALKTHRIMSVIVNIINPVFCLIMTRQRLNVLEGLYLAIYHPSCPMISNLACQSMRTHYFCHESIILCAMNNKSFHSMVCFMLYAVNISDLDLIPRHMPWPAFTPLLDQSLTINSMIMHC